MEYRERFIPLYTKKKQPGNTLHHHQHNKKQQTFLKKRLKSFSVSHY